MNYVADAIRSLLRKTHSSDELMHYGVKRRSGRYPYGSGENPYQHSGDFIGRYKELKDRGLSETEIAEEFGMSSTTQLRLEYRIAKNEQRGLKVATAKDLQAKGYSLTEIGRQMGVNESTVRSYLKEESEARMNQAQKTSNFLKEQVDAKGMIDVGVGVEKELGITRTKMDEALYLLKREGYEVYGGRVPQVTNPGRHTTISVLCKPGTEHKDIFDYGNVKSITEFKTRDGGETFEKGFVYPKSMNSNRLKIRYAEEGGDAKDGLIEIRRNVDDLSLGNSRYAQVRILVDDTHYLKGMAVYSDDLPPGVDIMFNTNKPKGTPALGDKNNTVLKNISTKDPDNPFGSLIKEKGGQSHYIDKDGKRQLSLINKRAEEGDWDDWANTLPSQFLAKQNKNLITKQINLSISNKQAEFEEIRSLTNPTVKKHLLKSFSDDCDATAVHLKAASLPRQRWQVMLPVPTMKDNEIYAPNYKNGEKVALVRYPHGGIFEIPILKVNNKQPDAMKMMGSAFDAVGLNSKVAAQLSGADFDGDTVMLIPTHDKGGKVKISSKSPLQDLEGFDPKLVYGGKPEGTFKVMKDTQKQMGVITNLIADMTIKGATDKELARAVKHSMVVIDAEKHRLDYKQSYIDNDIETLKKIYQPKGDGEKYGGASTLMTRAKSQASVLERQGQPHINKKGNIDYDPNLPEGAYIYKNSGREKVRVLKDGTEVRELRTTKSTQMAEARDARELISEFESAPEIAYANYANTMKKMAMEARKEMVYTKELEYNREANKRYSEQVKSLRAQLNISERNAPRERMAQLQANSIASAKKKDNPDMTKKEFQKVKQQELTKARAKVGAKRTPIEISDKEWEAIQAGAVTKTELAKILKYAKPERVRELATPKINKNNLSQAQKNKIKAMSMSNYSNSEIAESMNISPSTVLKYLKNETTAE